MTTKVKKQSVTSTADAGGQQVLPQQTMNFSVPEVQPTANLSITSVSGLTYSSRHLGYFLDGNIVFNLDLPVAVPVSLTLNICQVTDEGPIFAPLSISVNNYSLVKAYTDQNVGYHDVTWTIPAFMLNAGANQMVVSIDSNYTSNLLIDAVTVVGAQLVYQTINLSVADPRQTACYSMPFYSGDNGVGFDSTMSAWAFTQPGGLMRFEVDLSSAIAPISLWMTIAAQLGPGGVSNSPMTITVNGQFFQAINWNNSFFNNFRFTIPWGMLQVGANLIELSLDSTATYSAYINSTSVQFT